MTDPRTPDHSPDAEAPVDPDEAAVTAYVDEEATIEQVERVEADPDLLARAERYRSAADQIRAVPPAPDGSRDAAVAAALDAFPTGASAEGPSAADRGTLIDLGSRRARWRRLPLAAVAAAAAVLLVLVGAIGWLGSSDRDNADTAARSAEDTTASAADAASGGAESGPLPDTLGAPETGRFVDGRLTFADVDELAAYLEERTATSGDSVDERTAQDLGTASSGSSAGDSDGAAPSTSAPPPVDPCDAVSVADLDPTAVVAILPALVDGRPVTAIVHQTDDAAVSSSSTTRRARSRSISRSEPSVRPAPHGWPGPTARHGRRPPPQPGRH